MRQSGRPVPKVKRILEVNGGHAVLDKLSQALTATPKHHSSPATRSSCMPGAHRRSGQVPIRRVLRGVAEVMAKAL